jgi:murein DD-endopeptidase MepM/ murein hydrolase activator NlpD
MQKNFKEQSTNQNGETENTKKTSDSQPNRASSWMQSLIQMGLGESLLRATTNIFSVTAILVVIWLGQMYFRQPAKAQGNNSPLQSPTLEAAAPQSASAPLQDLSSIGILRLTNMHTNIASRARDEITKYTVQPGDTVSGIADNFGLKPQTIFSANYYILLDDPHNLKAGQVLNILPVDGVYREWQAGEGLNGVASFYQVKPEDIINYPLNHLDASTIGDYAHPNIQPGTWIVVPGGVYQYHAPGSVPLGITRSNPASAQVGGTGACPPVTGGAVGYGTFVYPTDRHYLSGYDYSTKTNHLGIDLAANLGDNIYAADGGVVVYAGWNDYGYGNMIMIDHGTGFQSLYAHLSQIFVQCGNNVTQGQTIAAAGATGHASGPHLHFEIRTATAVVNPWDLLPAP